MKNSRLQSALRNRAFSWCIFIFGAVITTPASAINALQLGPGSGPGWSYDTGTQTWVYSGASSFDLTAYANATTAEGGNGAYAWATEPDPNRFAYLVASTVPDLGNADAFDISVAGASLIESGYGVPLITDPNSIAPHGIFNTYFEIYEFQFDGPWVDIFDTQPGQTGTGTGYAETFGITVNSMLEGLTGIHFDLFTVSSGQYNPGGQDIVEAFAPFSHDAQYNVPIPAAIWLFGSGLLGLIGIARRKKAA